MNNIETNSMNVARLLGRTVVSAYKMQVDKIVPAFDEAETLCLSMVSSEKEKLEVKRRVAEWKMKLLCERDAPFTTVKLLYNNISELGYTNLEVEGTIEIYFAQYCERQGKIDDARRILQQLRTKLDSILKEGNIGVNPHFKEVSEEILARIDTDSK